VSILICMPEMRGWMVQHCAAGEYGLMGLLALGMCYVLLLANGSADFGVQAPKPAQAPWPQPRQNVPGWLSLHLSYLERLSDTSSSQVFPLQGQPSLASLKPVCTHVLVAV
jgi:hypothetical protein